MDRNKAEHGGSEPRLSREAEVLKMWCSTDDCQHLTFAIFKKLLEQHELKAEIVETINVKKLLVH